MPELPAGTVTFLFTDIEGSTRLWEQQPEAMREALAHHDRLLRQAIEDHHGHVFKTMGDAFCAAFAAAPAALAAALAAQRALQAEPWMETGPLRVRMALHTGTAQPRDADYFGPPLNRVARLLVVGHGGQILLSAATEGLARMALPVGAGLRDLGAHRLKDLQQPEHLFQLLHPDLPAEFPPLRSLSAFAHNLPVQLTRFIGREREIAEVKRLLTTTHLLTLTGSGGCGKTRLALQVAADLVDEYAGGVWVVEFAALSDPALVPQAVAAALGVREEPDRSLLATLTDYLRPQSLLLLLDNCEHLLAVCAELADALLRACPHLRLLASSREGLGIAGERTYRVPSLSAPGGQAVRRPGGQAVRRSGGQGPTKSDPSDPSDPSDSERLNAQDHRFAAVPPERLMQFEAVQLFVDRAAFHQPSFTITERNAAAVAQVCHRLDGIPLALELAAARVKALPVDQIAARLDDRFRLLTGGSRTALPRQQTLRALIDWSYNLLTGPERMMLNRLSVFAGGWTLEAAEAVTCVEAPVPTQWVDAWAGNGAEAWEGLDLLTSLVEKSLVVYEEQDEQARYRLLETVRQYARDRLLESGEAAAVRGWHRDWFLERAERAEQELVGPDQAGWLERLRAEHHNLRAALEWCVLDPESTDIGLRLAAGLLRYWDIHGHYTEGSDWLERLLANSDPASCPAYATGLWAAGTLAWLQGDNDRAVALARQSLALAREIGDKTGIARSLHRLGAVTYVQGDVASARVLAEETLSIYRELGDRRGVAHLLHFRGVLSLREGDCPAAGALFEESLAISRELGNRQAIALGIYCLALVAQGRGEDRAADTYLRESVAIAQELGYQRLLVMCVEAFAAGAAAEGRNEQAARLLGAADRMRELMHLPPQPNEGASVVRSLAVVRAALGDSAFDIAWAEGQDLSLEEAISRGLGN